MTDILEHSERIDEIIKTETRETAAKFGDERRTEISAAVGDVEDEDLIPVEDCILTLTEKGYMKRQTVDTYKASKQRWQRCIGYEQKRRGRGKDYVCMLYSRFHYAFHK